MKEIEFEEIKKFVEVMSRQFRSTNVMKISLVMQNGWSLKLNG